MAFSLRRTPFCRAFCSGMIKCSEDISIFDKPLTIRLIQESSYSRSRCIRGFRDGNHNIDLIENLWSQSFAYPLCKLVTHPLPTAVNAYAIDHRIWTSERD